MTETTPNYWPAILGTSIAVLWFIHIGLSIGFEKRYDNYRSKMITFFNNKPIIIPSFIVLVSPFILTRLALPEYELTGAFKQVLSIFTFVLGVVIAREKEKSDARKRNKILVNSLLIESFENLKKLKINEKRIQNKSKRRLLKINIESVENQISLMAKTKEVSIIKLVGITYKTSPYIKRLADLNSKIKKYNGNLSKNLDNSTEYSQELLRHICEMSKEIKQVTKDLSKF